MNYYQRLFYLLYRLTKYSNIRLHRYTKEEMIRKNLIGIQIVTGYYFIVIFGSLREILKKVYFVEFSKSEMQVHGVIFLISFYALYYFQLKWNKKYLKVIDVLDKTPINLKLQFAIFAFFTFLLTAVFLFVSN